MIPAVGSAISRSQPKSFLAASETSPAFAQQPFSRSSASAAFRAASRAVAVTGAAAALTAVKPEPS